MFRIPAVVAVSLQFFWLFQCRAQLNCLSEITCINGKGECINPSSNLCFNQTGVGCEQFPDFAETCEYAELTRAVSHQCVPCTTGSGPCQDNFGNCFPYIGESTQICMHSMKDCVPPSTFTSSTYTLTKTATISTTTMESAAPTTISPATKAPDSMAPTSTPSTYTPTPAPTSTCAGKCTCAQLPNRTQPTTHNDCYCDGECSNLKDCCPDYHTICPVCPSTTFSNPATETTTPSVTNCTRVDDIICDLVSDVLCANVSVSTQCPFACNICTNASLVSSAIPTSTTSTATNNVASTTMPAESVESCIDGYIDPPACLLPSYNCTSPAVALICLNRCGTCATEAPTPSPTQVPTTFMPTSPPTMLPTIYPTSIPTLSPSEGPTWSPTAQPSYTPTNVPTVLPTPSPTFTPTSLPTSSPTKIPTATPTRIPTATPTAVPTSTPTSPPTMLPTIYPTSIPTLSPSEGPTWSPTAQPSHTPTNVPTVLPTPSPTFIPTSLPTSSPTNIPTATPTAVPTNTPTGSPTSSPLSAPTMFPTDMPTSTPTRRPSTTPTATPTAAPSTVADLCLSIECGANCTWPCGWSTTRFRCEFGQHTSRHEYTAGSCPFLVDTCENIRCVTSCDGPCGWSSKANKCQEGHKTTLTEANNQTLLALCPSPVFNPCSSIKCGINCTGECGWSTLNDECQLGQHTSKHEESSGDCDTLDTCGEAACVSECMHSPCGWSSSAMQCVRGQTTTVRELTNASLLAMCPSTMSPTPAPKCSPAPLGDPNGCAILAATVGCSNVLVAQYCTNTCCV